MHDNINIINIIKNDINNNIEFEITIKNILDNNYNNLSDLEICMLYSQLKIDLEYINANFTQEDNINLQTINNYIYDEINNYCINHLIDNYNYTIDDIMPLLIEYYI
ncbi:unknown similar to AMEV006 [Choristoneura biennis entomopoxvirus]|uniref:Uncharacterized protein n=1 Tax=Choristoneura biennis entomopoxvirus TaxID=10288 RepID=A0A916P165_CBEPV|nr:unknown similar to AMEV006 [Choristoneura biennis entomopoxvirus]CCU55634.1 unknown similar to AMEV006 [Choristoneura biennis entomopoxvirus]